MQKQLELRLFGSPQISIAGSSIFSLLASKAKALLFYLAVTQRAHSRTALAALLWMDIPEEQSRKNLSDVISLSRHWLTPYLQVERQTLAFNLESAYWLDVAELRTTLSSLTFTHDPQALTRALDLYTGNFLDGFFVRDAPLYETWLATQRDQLRDLVVRGWQSVADQHLAHGDYASGLAATQHLLTIAPWHETAHRQQMLLLALSGQRGAALAHYQRCQQVLADELDIQPAAETTALYEQIRLGALPVAPETRSTPSMMMLALPPAQVSTVPVTRNHNDVIVSTQSVSTQSVSAKSVPPEPPAIYFHAVPEVAKLYGRRFELNKLQTWLWVDQCRLIGLFGIGGQGKTTLAAKAVRLLQEEANKRKHQAPFTHVIWSSLSSAPLPIEQIYFWLRQLGHDSTLAVTPPGTPAAPAYPLDELISLLLETLRRQRCLLVLDDLDAIVEKAHWAGYLQTGYEAYGEIFKRLVESDHQSTLLLIGRERLHNFSHWEEQSRAVQSLQLEGIDIEASAEYLTHLGLTVAPELLTNLVRRYSGHPLSLQVLAETAHDFFGGDLAPFAQDETPILDPVETLLNEQLSRLPSAEQRVLQWLLGERRPLMLSELGSKLRTELTLGTGLSAVRSLLRRGLLEQKRQCLDLAPLIIAHLQQQANLSQPRIQAPKLFYPSPMLTLPS